MDVRSYRGADAGSDHALVMGKLKVKITSVKKTGLQRNPRYDVSKLMTQEQRQEFSVAISNRFQALADLEDGTIEKKWERVRTTFTSACEEVLGFRKRELKPWLSDDTIKKIEERRVTKQRLEQARTRTQKQHLQQEYNTKHKEVKRNARRDKRDLIDRLATEAEEAAGKNNM